MNVVLTTNHYMIKLSTSRSQSLKNRNMFDGFNTNRRNVLFSLQKSGDQFIEQNEQ